MLKRVIGFPHVIGKTFAYPAHLQCGKAYIAHVESVFGYSTKMFRESLGLFKSHRNDAIAIVVKEGEFFSESEKYNLLVRRRRRRKWEVGTRKWEVGKRKSEVYSFTSAFHLSPSDFRWVSV